MLNRRGFLVLSAVGAAAACSTTSNPAATTTSGASPNALDIALAPSPTQVDLGGVSVRTWAYDGQVPGREIRIRKGETLRAAVSNKLPADTSIHWHGLAIVNDMDGVPPLTQAPIPAGGRLHLRLRRSRRRNLLVSLTCRNAGGPRAVRSVDHRGSGREGGLRRGTGSGARRLDRRHRHQSGPGAGEPA